MEIAGYECKRNTKVRGALRIGNRPDGSDLTIPFGIISGATDGPVLGMDGATHGDEYEGPEAIMQLWHELNPDEMAGTCIMVPVLNVMAFEARDRAYLQDRHAWGDLNRNFPGRSKGATSERLAYAIFHELVLKSQYWLNFHSGGDYFVLPPKIAFEEVGDLELDKRTFDLARAFGVDILWRNLPHEGTLIMVAAKSGVVAICPEVGGSERHPDRRRNYVSICKRGILNCMKHVGILEGDPEVPGEYVFIEGETHQYANSAGFLRYTDGIREKVMVSKGDFLGTICDPMGEVIEELRAEWDGIVTLVRTMPVVHVGDWFIGIGRPIK